MKKRKTLVLSSPVATEAAQTFVDILEADTRRQLLQQLDDSQRAMEALNIMGQLETLGAITAESKARFIELEKQQKEILKALLAQGRSVRRRRKQQPRR